MKSLTVLSVLVAVILVVCVVVQANNVTWGYQGPYDRLLATDYVVKPSSWFVKQTATVQYPPKVSFLFVGNIQLLQDFIYILGSY